MSWRVWPSPPHPTAPGVRGSAAPTMSPGTYYLELARLRQSQRKVNQLKEILSKSKGQIQYDWKNVQYIQSKEQFY